MIAHTMPKLSLTRHANDPTALIERTINSVLDAYQSSEKELERLLREASTTTNRKRAQALLVSVRSEIKTMNKAIRNISKSVSEETYLAGLEIARSVANSSSIQGVVNWTSQINRGAVVALSEQISYDFLAANASINAMATRLISGTKQQILKDARIDKMISRGIIEGATLPTVKNRLLADLQKKAIDGKFIRINGREYRIDSYAELVVRTRTREAVSIGTVNAAQELGMDLVQIDIHGDACPQCQMRQGRVYSISGTNPSFPHLDQLPPYHGNCRCNIFPVSELALKERGQHAALSKLSKGTPRGYDIKQATEWLKKNPTKGIVSYAQYQRALDIGTLVDEPRGKTEGLGVAIVNVPSSLVARLSIGIN